MWKRKILFLLCLLCIRNSWARSFRPININYDYQMEGRRQTYTTAKPTLQKYWQNFVRNLPTLPAISWNITNPLGSFFNGDAQQIVETPVVMHVMEQPVKRKTKKVFKPKTVTKNKKSINYYGTYDSNYQQLQLQPLGLDHNKVMHFYEPSSGQYYALQVESRPNYYNGQYVNPYNKPYGNYYNQYNGYSGSQTDNYSLNGEDEHHNQNGGYNSGYGYDTDEGYASDDQSYHPEEGYESDQQNYVNRGDYGNDYEQNDVVDVEYDDGVELADNWGYNDEDIFADRKIKSGSFNNHNTFAESIIKIQKHLLKPETAEDVELLLSRDKKKTPKHESIAEKEETNHKDKESVRNVAGALLKHSAKKRNKQSHKRNKNIRFVSKPQNQMEYYIFPTNFWL